LGNNNNVIYPVTERINSSYTRQAYKTSFNRFQSVIKIHDLQVLRDLGPKVMEQMIIKYVINARDVKKLSRASIQAECDAIYHFCELNDLLLNKKKINRFLLPLLESFWLVSRTPYCLSQSSSSHDRPNFLYSSTPSLLL
jgi:hypothetical protein